MTIVTGLIVGGAVLTGVWWLGSLALAAHSCRMPAQHADSARRVVEDAVREAWEAARARAAAIAEPEPPVADRWQVAMARAVAVGRASVAHTARHAAVDPLTAPLEQVVADIPTGPIRLDSTSR